MGTKKEATQGAATKEHDAKVGNFIIFPVTCLQKICKCQEGFNFCLGMGILRYAYKKVKKGTDNENFTLLSCLRLYDEHALCFEWANSRIIEWLYDYYEGVPDYNPYDDSFMDDIKSPLCDNDKKLLTLFINVKWVVKSFGLNMDDSALNGIMSLFDSFLQLPENVPLCFVNPSFLIKVRDEAEKNRNNERERILFCLQMGISSIVGMKKEWCTTTQDMIKARMLGFAIPAYMEQCASSSYSPKWLKDVISKYTTRRRFTGLLDTIRDREWCKTIASTRHRCTIISVTKEIDFFERELRENFKRKHKPDVKEKRKLDRDKAEYFINYKPLK